MTSNKSSFLKEVHSPYDMICSITDFKIKIPTSDTENTIVILNKEKKIL